MAFTSLVGALNPIALHLGPIEVHWYGVIITTGVFIALWLSIREARRRQINPDDLYDFLLWALPVALISARIYYVVFQWSYYQHHLDQIIAIWDGGIAIYGSLIGAIIVVILFTRWRKIPTFLFLDVLAPTVIMAQGIGRWGNFMNQEAFGKITTLAHLQALHLPQFIITQMDIGGVYRTPTFLYESVWDIAGFVFLLATRHIKGLYLRGEVFFIYVAWYAFGRFFVEGMRTDSLMLGPARVSQWLSVVLFIGAWVWLIIRRRQHNVPSYLSGMTVTKK
ncbi:prolipoprotein diacylglyceryl transferase [Furfurilactobacillus rossiae]|uniref:Phosphatidylglycerol--prolipoprotein diacylglyceryl transferase n=1 Tax=Furfurilactobacillus rossiae DSM 15814 TaxID=1114972 RepID=A0A0R1RTG6_9LACO|nr:prolipoprotein diacylglyceryl transferase [Furfurilactobacillus rossiae]KRL56531.1 lgt protein [Furfurilactobacillus rossiae DSM 15814]MCF6164466.1 prolipoprotein diacylglyceryl transferase [Furfurilactobacillus rossiae]QFR66561.1 prolipoprotein diacylglyceryl transferase [Furfurilactobacillus rossiae]QLE62030.1 Prolipoprotein diacylglyceryl transferase [Furfurilactobacillus rossiae]QLE64750.1 Prolipoprotein diacylglyceryl transferase [Furfurilactobacillus rossiae]